MVLAESKNSIGVDIEELKDDITLNLIYAGFTKREKSWIKNSPLHFIFLGLERKVLLKCIGTGFGIAEREFYRINSIYGKFLSVVQHSI